MRHLMRRTIQGDWLSRGLSPFRLATVPLLLLFLLPLYPATDANAQFNGALRGEYDMSLHRTCWSNVPGTLPNMAMQGRLSFNGAGVVSLTGQALEPRPGGGGDPLYTQTDLTNCTGPYGANADGTFTATLNCSISVTRSVPGSPPVVAAGLLINLKLRGKLAHDGTVLVLGSTAAGATDVETQFCSGCIFGVEDRLCTQAGSATSRR